MSRRKKTKKIGPTGGLGVRYGVKARRRYSEILSEMRRKHGCPECSSKAVRRESVGIWVCTKCGFKFTGGAYVPETKLGVTAERSARRS
ncbi:MAG: 50S ribosomal protein L37ae [Candidatus Bathyarchaeota archaeon]|nr:50S ribosomal protein L37ae [Candidatus Bathyarchaeota archaeon]